jgi:hypothetical protein
VEIGAGTIAAAQRPSRDRFAGGGDMRRTSALVCLLAGSPALAAAGELPRIGLTLGTAQGTTIGAVVRVTDRLTSRSTLRISEWDVTSEFDLTGDLLRDRSFVPYLGAGVELLADDTGHTERTDARAVVGVRHDPTRHVRLFTEAVWNRRLSGAPVPPSTGVVIRLGAGVTVLF